MKCIEREQYLGIAPLAYPLVAHRVFVGEVAGGVQEVALCTLYRVRSSFRDTQATPSSIVAQ